MEISFAAIIPASSDEILGWWQAAHFTLNGEQQIRFKNDQHIKDLRKLHGQAVQEAILLNKIKKLKDVYLVALALQNAKMPPTSNAPSTPFTTFRKVTPSILRKTARKEEPQKKSKIITRSASSTRGRQSFKEHSMINPPPVENVNIDRSKLPNCSICNQPIVGAICHCW